MTGQLSQPTGRRARLITAGIGVLCLVGIAAFGARHWLSSSDSSLPAAAKPPQGVTAPAQTFNDLAYAGTSPAQKLDLYLPARTGVAIPVVVVIHGGGFSAGDKHDEPGIIHAVNAAGYAAASINYRLSGEAAFPAGVQDAKASVRWLRANAAKYGLDQGKMATWGTSAGGNLAAMVGVTGSTKGFLDDPNLGNADRSSAVLAVVDWYGPSDFLTMDAQAKDPGGCPGQPELHDPPNSPESFYLRAPIQSVPDKSHGANPITYLSDGGKQPAFYLAAGSADCTVPHAQSQELAEALQKANVPVSLTIVDHAGHADPALEAGQMAPSIAFLRGIFGH